MQQLPILCDCLLGGQKSEHETEILAASTPPTGSARDGARSIPQYFAVHFDDPLAAADVYKFVQRALKDPNSVPSFLAIK